MSNITPDQMNALLHFASKKLGTTPQALAKTIQTGGADSLMNDRAGGDMARLQALIGDKQKAKALLESPEVQLFLKKYLKQE